MEPKTSDPLRNIRIASPCSANWNEMHGTERVRHYTDCNLNVYNISRMTRPEAERLVASHEGRLCVRYYRRKDGTIITADCPVGLAALRRRVGLIGRSVASFLIGVAAGLGLTWAFEETPSQVPMGVIASPIAAPIDLREEMGDIAVPVDVREEVEVMMGAPVPQPLMGAMVETPDDASREGSTPPQYRKR